MYVCICKNVTERQIKQAVQAGEVKTVKDLIAACGACTQCGKCAVAAQQLIREAQTYEHDFIQSSVIGGDSRSCEAYA